MEDSVRELSTRTYKTRKSFLIPFAVDMALLFVLIIISLAIGGAPQETIVLVIVFVPLAWLFFEALFREAIITPEGVVIKKFLRKKELQWGDITHIGSMIVRKKVYLLLTSTKGFHIISNAFGNFTALVGDVVEGVESVKVEGVEGDKVEGGVQELFQNPVKRVADVAATWIAALLLAGVVYFKLIH